MQIVIDEAELRRMTPAQRQELARTLAAIDYPHPLLDLNHLHRRRKVGAVFFTVASLVLVAWIIMLALTLRQHFTSTHWRGAWVGFDFLELIAFTVTAWAFWRGRQIVIACLLITSTLMFCDAWFDVILDLETPDMWFSVGSALIVELPLAFAMLNAARRLIRMSALAALGAGGVRLPLPSLWKLPFVSGRKSS
jgi:hypothetical protein